MEERIKILRDSHSFILPILKILQDNGGELDSISQIDDRIPNYTDFTEEEINYSKITNKGNKYVPYYFGRNFALKNLELTGYLTYGKGLPIKLTANGLDVDTDSFNIDTEVYSKVKPYYDKKQRERREKRQGSEYPLGETVDEGEVDEPEDSEQEWRTEILDRIIALDWKQFEPFCRGLLTKMGFEVDREKGIKLSGDGGIDGYAYHTDDDSLKITKVAIQCKKNGTSNPVGIGDINGLGGAINQYGADYGILFTTSYYTTAAREAARKGVKPITLIDGNKLVDLMIKYNYKVRSVPYYEADEQYFGL